jgi:hypothetical protein
MRTIAYRLPPAAVIEWLYRPLCGFIRDRSEPSEALSKSAEPFTHGPNVNAPEPRVNATAEAAASSAKSCVIFAEPAGSAHYGWGWRSGNKRSQRLFRYFYECVQDARKHGHAVDFAQVAESLKAGRGPDG